MIIVHLEIRGKKKEKKSFDELNLEKKKHVYSHVVLFFTLKRAVYFGQRHND